ncbi:hypothetical protein C6499_11985 [Candidatus Poribacteria bacterium]|nr:MAG: hypothetical protein C6499_11985 [Candidatus Poribacteria bacterium]
MHLFLFPNRGQVMKERIVFFILGAVLATIAYSVGNVNKVNADGDGVYERLFVNKLMVKTLLVTDMATDIANVSGSNIGLVVENNIPTILLNNQKNGIAQSSIMLSAFSVLDEPGQRPTITLLSNNLKENYTFSSKGE